MGRPKLSSNSTKHAVRIYRDDVPEVSRREIEKTARRRRIENIRNKRIAAYIQMLSSSYLDTVSSRDGASSDDGGIHDEDESDITTLPSSGNKKHCRPSSKEVKNVESEASGKEMSDFRSNPQMQKRFIDVCLREVNTCDFQGSSLKQGSWERLREEVIIEFGQYSKLTDLSNKWDYLKNLYQAWDYCYKKTEHAFDATTGKFDFPQPIWDEIIRLHPLALTFRHTPLEYVDKLRTLFERRLATEDTVSSNEKSGFGSNCQMLKKFIDVFLREVKTCDLQGSSLKQSSLERLREELIIESGQCFKLTDLSNKWDYLKKLYQAWDYCYRKTAHAFNALAGTFDFPQPIWDEITRLHPLALTFRHKPLEYVDELRTLFEGRLATEDTGISKKKCDFGSSLQMQKRFIDVCLREVNTSDFQGSSLKQGSWERLREKIIIEFGQYFKLTTLMNKWDYLKRLYQAWDYCYRISEHALDATTGTFNFPQRTWDDIIRLHPFAMAFRHKPLECADELRTLFERRFATEDTASGKEKREFGSNLQMQKRFVDVCLKVVKTWDFEGGLLKQVAWYRLREEIIFEFGQNFKLGDLKNKWDYLKKLYQAWDYCFKKDKHAFVATTGTFDFPQPIWDEIIKLHPFAMIFRHKPLVYIDELRKLFEGRLAAEDIVRGPGTKNLPVYVFHSKFANGNHALGKSNLHVDVSHNSFVNANHPPGKKNLPVLISHNRLPTANHTPENRNLPVHVSQNRFPNASHTPGNRNLPADVSRSRLPNASHTPGNRNLPADVSHSRVPNANDKEPHNSPIDVHASSPIMDSYFQGVYFLDVEHVPTSPVPDFGTQTVGVISGSLGK